MRATVGEEVFGCRQRGLLASTQLNARMLSPELASESQGRHAKRAVIQRGRKINAEQRIRAQGLRFNAGRKLGQIQKITGIYSDSSFSNTCRSSGPLPVFWSSREP